jgi:membrane protein DedA with SNARE-associated domain
MGETILKIISVYFSTMLKFIFGPLGGYAAKLNFLTTVLTSVAGMMTVVLLFTFFGEWLRKNVLSKFSKKQSKFSVNNKRFVSIWKKYGLVGVAILTPLILTPIGGTILAVSSGSPKDKIIFYMFISAAIWSLVFSGIIYFFGKQVLPDFME